MTTVSTTKIILKVFACALFATTCAVVVWENNPAESDSHTEAYHLNRDENSKIALRLTGSKGGGVSNTALSAFQSWASSCLVKYFKPNQYEVVGGSGNVGRRREQTEDNFWQTMEQDNNDLEVFLIINYGHLISLEEFIYLNSKVKNIAWNVLNIRFSGEYPFVNSHVNDMIDNFVASFVFYEQLESFEQNGFDYEMVANNFNENDIYNDIFGYLGVSLYSYYYCLDNDADIVCSTERDSMMDKLLLFHDYIAELLEEYYFGTPAPTTSPGGASAPAVSPGDASVPAAP